MMPSPVRGVGPVERWPEERLETALDMQPELEAAV
jgi:hypothetical protein